MSQASAEAADGLPLPQRHWAVFTIGVAIMMAVLDGAIANVALPTIARDVNASPATSIWVVNAYQLAITISLLPLASLGDILGYRRVYQVGLAVFTLASLGCALSHTLLALTLVRIVQGFGAAGVMSVNTALVRFIWPRSMLGRGIGVNALVVAGAAAVGPTIAAAILAVGPWEWLFAINVPLGIVAFGAAAFSLPRARGAARHFDIRSAVLNALAFGLIITAVDSLGHGEGGIAIGVELAVGIASAVVLVRRQLRMPHPLLPVDLLRIPVFALSVATSVCSFVAQGLAYVSLPFYFQNVLGHTQVETGLLMTPWPVMVAIVAPVSGRLADRYPAGILGGIGLAAMAAGMMLLATLPPSPGALTIAWRMALCGFGFALFQSPNNRAMLAAAPRDRSGGASGMLSTARLLGQTFGAALVAMIFGMFPVHPNVLTLVVAAGFAATAALVSSLRMMNRRAPA